MSYGLSAALQAAVFETLVGDAAIGSAVGQNIYDVMPAGPVPDTYVSLGPEDVRDRSDESGSAAEHRFTVSVVTASAGFQRAKSVAVAISNALDGSAPAMTRGRVVSIRFLKARARRVRNGEIRRIDLTFRARVEGE